MDLETKQNNRYKFRLYSIALVFATLVSGVVLTYLEKSTGFAGIAAGVFTFAGIVFGADYFSKPTGDK